MQVAALDPEAEEPDIRRICYAYVADAADPETLVQRLQGLPEVGSAAVPPERHAL
jgi:hypothetical protein